MLGMAHDSLPLGMKASLAPSGLVEHAAIFYMTEVGANERCSWSWERHDHNQCRSLHTQQAVSSDVRSCSDELWQSPHQALQPGRRCSL